MGKSIAEILSPGKAFSGGSRGRDIIIILLLGLSSAASFGLGRLSALEEARGPVRIEKGNMTAESTVAAVSEAQAAAMETVVGEYVASKNGSAYHFPWCSGAKRIKEENKVYFDTKEAAEAAGYRPAANCQGL